MKVSDEELQQYSFALGRAEYEELVKYNNSEEAKLAKACEIDNSYQTIIFIQELLLRAFPYVATNEEAARKLIEFADKAAENGDAFIVEFLTGQIDQCESAVKLAKEWAEIKIKNQIKEFYQN